MTIGAWLLVVLLLLGGSAIASSAQTHAFGNVDLTAAGPRRPAQHPRRRRPRARRPPRLLGAAGQPPRRPADDAGGPAYAVVHNDWTTRFPTVLARGDDIGAPDLDDTWWVSLVQQPFGSQEEAAAWCSGNGLAAPACTPREVGG